MVASRHAHGVCRRAAGAFCAVLTALSACSAESSHAPRLGGMMRHPGEARLARPPDSPAPDWHVRRNRHNQCPRTEPAIRVPDCRQQAWAPDDWLTVRLFHGGGWLGNGYRTYRSAEAGGDGGFQCTYDRNHDLVTSGRHRGTYDYVRPEVSTAAHLDSDVEPHEHWPRAYEDPDRTLVYECAANG
jgi:hypothetical protein